MGRTPKIPCYKNNVGMVVVLRTSVDGIGFIRMAICVTCCKTRLVHEGKLRPVICAADEMMRQLTVRVCAYAMRVLT